MVHLLRFKVKAERNQGSKGGLLRPLLAGREDPCVRSAKLQDHLAARTAGKAGRVVQVIDRDGP